MKNEDKKSVTPENTPKKAAFGTLVEGAFVVMIGQNALLVSKPFISLFMGNMGIVPFLLLIAIGVINTINIIFVWLSSKENAEQYSAKYFVWDVITLVLLFSLAQICIDAFEDGIFKINIRDVILVFSIVYIIIYFGYVFWNLEEIQLNGIQGKEKRKIYFLNAYIIFYILTLATLLVACLLKIDWFMHTCFLVSLAVVSFIFFIFCKNYVK